jgi:manganese-dependent inorganic pyrophosphatase
MSGCYDSPQSFVEFLEFGFFLLTLGPMSTAPFAPSANSTYVIGHRNPDADAICSAISYAAYKEARGERGHVAARCGNSNARIDTILGRFKQPLPVYLSDVWPKVRDLMASNVVTVSEEATCAEALELIDRHNIGILPVVDVAGCAVGTIALPHLGGIFIPQISKPKLMRQVHGTLANIARALRATVIHAVDDYKVEDFYVRLGTMDISSFWRISEAEGIPASKSLIIVGDRKDIQLRAIELGLSAASSSPATWPSTRRWSRSRRRRASACSAARTTPPRRRGS